MKFCSKTCALAVILSGGSLYTMIGGKKKNVISDFKKSLNKEQLKKYEEIAVKRRNLYRRGLMVGGVLSALFLLYKRQSLLTVNTVCLSLAITLTTAYLHYMLAPKGDYMISELKSKEQTEKWLAIYRVMQYNYNMGMVLSILAVLVASQTVCA